MNSNFTMTDQIVGSGLTDAISVFCHDQQLSIKEVIHWQKNTLAKVRLNDNSLAVCQSISRGIVNIVRETDSRRFVYRLSYEQSKWGLTLANSEFKCKRCQEVNE